MKTIIQKHIDLLKKEIEWAENKRIELESKEKIDISKLKEIFKFPLLYQGWEGDQWGYIKIDENSSRKYIVLTDHGKEYIAFEEELEKFEESYKNALGNILTAKKLLHAITF